jgi:hypothetical protein
MMDEHSLSSVSAILLRSPDCSLTFYGVVHMISFSKVSIRPSFVFEK